MSASATSTAPGGLIGTGGPPFTPEMARGMSEATLQGHILHTAAALGWLCYHTHDSRRSQPGFPDLTLVHPIRRRLIFAELKKENGRQTPEQHKWEDALRAAGHGEFYLWRPSHWLSCEITRILQARATVIAIRQEGQRQ